MRQTVLTYREILWTLREFEGWRYLRWPAAAVAIFVGVWALPVCGAIGAFYLAKEASSFEFVVLDALVTVSLSAAGARYSQRRPWRALLERRAWQYLDIQTCDPQQLTGALVRKADYERAAHALRRAGLNGNLSRWSSSPPDAPELDWWIQIFRPGVLERPGARRVEDVAIDALRDAGIEGRVHGRDVAPALAGAGSPSS